MNTLRTRRRTRLGEERVPRMSASRQRILLQLLTTALDTNVIHVTRGGITRALMRMIAEDPSSASDSRLRGRRSVRKLAFTRRQGLENWAMNHPSKVVEGPRLCGGRG